LYFDFSNYWIFIAALAAIYTIVLTYIQSNIGGKDRLKNLQLEMRQVQMKMSEAAKKKNDRELDELMSKNWKLTMDLMGVQMQLFVILLGVLFILMQVFPFVEPGLSDDSRMQLFDDGLAAHCDAVANDGIYSSCFTLPQNGTRGAWIVDAYLYSATGEQLSRGSAPIYLEGGKLEDVWLQNHSQTGLLDMAMGKTAYTLNVSTGKQNYTAGESVPITVGVSPPLQAAQAAPDGKPIAGPRLEAVVNTGTAFYVDLPFPLPLINISRISGSYGVFIFYAFVIGIALSIGKSLAGAVMKKS
jgi:hypothetical protein